MVASATMHSRGTYGGYPRQATKISRRQFHLHHSMWRTVVAVHGRVRCDHRCLLCEQSSALLHHTRLTKKKLCICNHIRFLQFRCGARCCCTHSAVCHLSASEGQRNGPGWMFLFVSATSLGQRDVLRRAMSISFVMALNASVDLRMDTAPSHRISSAGWTSSDEGARSNPRKAARPRNR